MLVSSLAERLNLYGVHFRTLINNSDKHGRSSKHGAVEVERCFDGMNGSEKVSSETSLGCSTIELKAIDSGWSLFCCRCTGSNPKGRGAEETRERLPAQRARREAPQRPPAKQADPLTAHPKIVKATGSGWSLFC